MQMFMKLLHKKGIRALLLSVIVLCAISQNIRADPLKEHIRVAVVAQNAPYQFIEEDGTLAGLHIDLLEQIADQQNWKITYILMDSTSQCLDALRANRCDVVMGLTENADEKGVLYTDELSASTLAMLVSQKTADALMEDPAYTIRSASYEYNTLKNFQLYTNSRVYNWIAVSSQDRALDAMLSGDTDAVLGLKESMVFRLKELQIDDNYIIYYGNVQSVQLVMAVAEDNPVLCNKINESLNKLRVTGEYDNIIKTWSVDESPEHISLLLLWKKYRTLIILVLSVILAFICTATLMTLVLKREVTKKTSELTKANQALQEQIIYANQENELRFLIVENNPNAIFLLNSDYLIVVTNQSALNLMMSLGSIDGASALDYPLLREIMQGKETALSNGVSFIDKKYALSDLQKPHREFQYSLIPLSKKVKCENILIILKDITLEQQENERLVTIEKAKMLNQMVAGIAHEIRNPLMSIKTYGQLIGLKSDDISFIRNFASIVPEEVDRINRLLENLINFARQTPPSKEKVPIEPMLKKCALLLQSKMKKSKISFALSVQKDMELFVDYDCIHQVVLNILLNAIQAIEEKQQQGGYNEQSAEIRCHAWMRAEEGCIQIRDNGIGMDKKALDAVMLPFYTTKADGTGLGMAISSNYMHANNGTIHIESEYGKFTTVTLSFIQPTGIAEEDIFDEKQDIDS